LSTVFVERVLEDEALPSPGQQADNLLLWLGSSMARAGERIDLPFEEVTAIIGAVESADVEWAVTELRKAGLITDSDTLPGALVSLTLTGWQRFEELKRGRTAGRKAFMAMKIGDATLDSVFRDCFKLAASDAGFRLIRVDEEPPAGLIDSRIRAEIRSSRFLVADLTDQNLGAYWEAGFAEGLGKPVIYTCRRDYFESPGTHFDTNHHHTVRWSPENLGDTRKELAAAIRATLPTLATFEARGE